MLRPGPISLAHIACEYLYKGWSLGRRLCLIKGGMHSTLDVLYLGQNIESSKNDKNNSLDPT